MGKNIEEYLNQFRSETFELIVRISWCWEKGHSGKFDIIENFYKVRARFDMALIVKTNEIIDSKDVAYNWLEWLAPEKKFGFKYGHKFKRGSLYRVLVREKITQKQDRYRAYFIEQVLEQYVTEPRLDPQCIFESGYEEQATERIVLIKSASSGAHSIQQATFIASIEGETDRLCPNGGVLCPRWGVLTWFQKHARLQPIHKLEGLQAYLVRVRKSKENDRQYMLQKVLKKVTDERFEKIKEAYKKPVILRSPLGNFELDRARNRFKGSVDYLGKACDVFFEVAEGETTAEPHLRKLGEICHDLERWDAWIREKVSDELLGLANEWNETESEITKGEFVGRMGIPDMVIEADGAVVLWFLGEDLFGDHRIEVRLDENGNYTYGDLVG